MKGETMKTSYLAAIAVVVLLSPSVKAAVEPPLPLDPNTCLFTYEPNSCPSVPVDWVIFEPNKTYEITIQVWKLTGSNMDVVFSCTNPESLNQAVLPIGRIAHSNGWIYQYRVYWNTPSDVVNVVYYFNISAQNHTHPKDLRPNLENNRTYLIMVANANVPIILQPQIPQLTTSDARGNTPWRKVPEALKETLQARGQKRWQHNSKWERGRIPRPTIVGIRAERL
jgi:hypothetical protein